MHRKKAQYCSKYLIIPAAVTRFNDCRLHKAFLQKLLECANSNIAFEASISTGGEAKIYYQFGKLCNCVESMP